MFGGRQVKFLAPGNTKLEANLARPPLLPQTCRQIHRDLPTLLSCKPPLLFSNSPVTGHSGEKVDRTWVPSHPERPQKCARLIHGFGRKTPSPKQIPRQQINHEIYRNDSCIYYFNLQRSDSGHAIKGEITLREGLTVNGAYIS